MKFRLSLSFQSPYLHLPRPGITSVATTSGRGYSICLKHFGEKIVTVCTIYILEIIVQLLKLLPVMEGTNITKIPMQATEKKIVIQVKRS